ncbi:LOW QUALITY PROTEIN: germination protein, Ger(x)C family [Ruminiclostridium papyrosolvens DSM 2782]|jgi:spore germination protein KC|uniref:Germination protein, Ger(X)C family n=1 Tax=Ruminiclostridium papyrosolvens DSM 2782 TaxID=588581 RepID=F1T7Y4_9FIRM|nr:Ger(x)C family spore germination protein [Ruminiclostridium papyrosolvens]EGD49582.1 LOW QUALITY PROTEIN: germination protein, Ger(x)C family [Ruminiclostridium papyrosolvens DSM 2782]WES33292.1 Ger(x)C family spore germination protein [Ruminiclostridium papyrosolvens DSM 2782]
MRRIILLISTCVILMLGLTACYDARELDDSAHVVTLGIDKGVSDKWRITVQFSTAKESSGGGGGGMEQDKKSGGGQEESQDGYTFVTIDTPSFFTGINMLNTTITRRLNFMHTQVLVFSEELAKEGLIGEFLAPMARYREIRRSLHVIVSKEPATDFIKENKPLFGTTLSKGMETMSQEANEISLFPHVTLNNLYDGMKSTYRQPIAILAAINDFNNYKEKSSEFQDNSQNSQGRVDYYAGELPRRGGSKIEFLGSALFNGDRMVGELNGEETRVMLIGKGDFKNGFFTIPDPKNPGLAIALDVRQTRKPNVKIKFEEGKPVINLKLQLEGDILAIQSRVNYESTELKPLLESAFEQYLKNGLDSLIEKCKNLKVDVFNFGDTAIMQFGTIQEWEKYNWKKQFEKSQINTEVKFTIRKPGTMLKSSPIISTEGKE